MWPSSSSKPSSPSSPFPFTIPDLPKLPITLPEEDKKFIARATILTTSFYVVQLISQRVLGLMKLHGGRQMLITSTVGCAVTATNLYLCQKFENVVMKQTDNYGFEQKKANFLPGIFSGNRNSPKRAQRKETLRRVYLGVGVFLALEQGAFRTAFPSSLLTLGVFANNANMLRRSIVSTSAIATESQRIKIQKLGKRFGCHHCGSRQVFKKEVFIADHMPPTKQAKEMSEAWWRKFLNIEVSRVFFILLPVISLTCSNLHFR